MDKIIYEVTAKCPPAFKRGKQERTYHAAVCSEGNYTIFQFEETWREMTRKRFPLQEGFTLVTSEGTWLVLSEWHESNRNVRPNRVYCKAIKVAGKAA